MSNRFNEVLGSTPPATLLIITTCAVVYGLQILMDLDLQRFTMCPRLVLYIHEYYRMVTSALFHGSFMHIGVNMLSTFHLSSMLEKRLGTLPHLMTALGAILVTSVVYIFIAWSVSFLLGYDSLMYEHSVGFSGVLFHFCVLECNLVQSPSRSLFGMVNVPTQSYPWALLVALQVFMPNLSFLGHLSGIITGTLQYYGLLGVMTIGREVNEWPSNPMFARIPGFVGASENRHFQDPQSLMQLVNSSCRSVGKVIGYVLETLSVCIFGRGYRWNSNIRLWRSTDMSGGRMLSSSLEDDKEWGGLPAIASLGTDSVKTSQIV
jgi:rhomboid domain-containing protein 1